MIFRHYHPSPTLHEYVAGYNLRHFEFESNVTPPFKPYPPRPEQALCFFPRDPEIAEFVEEGKKIPRPRSVLLGQQTQRMNRHVGRNFIVLIVNFQPGALHRLTGLPLPQLTNGQLDAEAFFSPEIRKVNQRLNSTIDYQEMIEIVETFLLSLVQKVKIPIHPIDRIGILLLQHPDPRSLDYLAREACLSPRQFERKFSHRFGVGPKLFARIVRFNNSYKCKFQHPGMDWRSIAWDCGYYDYQHLVKDYRQFAHTTPNTIYHLDSHAPERFFGYRDFTAE
jgi:AraC-like DNA-binding protein